MKAATALVTGGGRGIGRAICRRLAGDGWTTIAASRTESQLLETKSLVESDGGRCDVRVVDLCHAGEIKSTVEAVARAHNGISMLVNCAGAIGCAPISELTDDDFRRMLDINVAAVFHATKAVWSIMQQQRDGVIVNISSVASFDPFPGLSAYGASKAWVNLWTRGLAAEGKPHGIRLFSVAPGAVETAMLRGAFPDFPADETLDPMDIANVVALLAHPDCRYASGETVTVKK